MTLRDILPILWRWWWLIVAITLLTTLLLALRLRPVYVAQVSLQISQPPSEQVVLFEQSAPYSNLRDELTIARNNLIVAIRRPEVRTQTIEALALHDAARDYQVDVIEVRDSDFVTLTVEAPTPMLARAIADAHAVLAIKHAARLRAMPAVAAKQLVSDQLAASGAALETAEREASGASASSSAQGKLTQALADYTFWRRKLNEAEIKASNAYAESFMQLVAGAELPLQPSTQKMRTQMAMGMVGSLMLGVILAILLETIIGRMTFRKPAAVTASQRSRVAT